jgi:membrane protein DedA with SNARE-associated domain
MPAAAGAVEMPYRVFAISNLVGGVVWGVGYSLLGYVAGSAYGVVERAVGTGLAVAVALIVLVVAATWAWRRHRGNSAGPTLDPAGPVLDSGDAGLDARSD